MSIVIPQSEFQERIVRFQAEMAARNLDAILVYGDEYRKENLRYVSNFWPIFERAVCMIPKSGNPVVAGAPEGESYAKEMSVWKDYVNVREFACVSVPEEIDYPLAKFVKLSDVIGQRTRRRQTPRRRWLVGHSRADLRTDQSCGSGRGNHRCAADHGKTPRCEIRQ